MEIRLSNEGIYSVSSGKISFSKNLCCKTNKFLDLTEWNTDLRLYWGGPVDLVGVLLTGRKGCGEAGQRSSPEPPLTIPVPLFPLFFADLLSSLWELRCRLFRSSWWIGGTLKIWKTSKNPLDSSFVKMRNQCWLHSNKINWSKKISFKTSHSLQC